MPTLNELLITKDQLDQACWQQRSVPEVAVGQVLCEVDSFALTANNISYADHGTSLGYWQFFPAPEGFGILPVWGFATVRESAVDHVSPGERLFGFLPLASHLLMTPGSTNAYMVEDTPAHRQTLPRVYNQYFRCAADPLYQPEFEAQQALFKPLFITAFVADDFLAQEAFFGATQILISSASSKTAMAIAHRLRLRPEVSCLGLTSSGNVEFTEGLGCYDQVCAYEDVNSLDPDSPSVYVDIAGNGALRDGIHQHFDSHLTYSCSIGGSHWQSRSDKPPQHGPAPKFLFAPSHVDRRIAEWGAARFQQTLAQAWQDFLPVASAAVVVAPRVGPKAIEDTYKDLLAGSNDPSQGYMASWR